MHALPRNYYERLIRDDSDKPQNYFKLKRGFDISKIHVKRLLTYYGRPDQGPPEELKMERSEELRLFRVRRRSAVARDKLVRRYLCWAFKIAAKLKGPRLEFDEAVSAANAGLMEAIEGYNPDSGYMFTTYSAIIIRRHVINALIATYPVKISDHLRKKFAERSRMDPKELEKLLKGDEPKTLADLFERLAEVPDFDVNTLFVRQEDAPFMPAEGESPAETCETGALSDELRNAIRRILTPLEREAIMCRHYKNPPQSFERIARRLSRSKTKVREAHDVALIKLRTYMEAR